MLICIFRSHTEPLSFRADHKCLTFNYDCTGKVVAVGFPPRTQLWNKRSGNPKRRAMQIVAAKVSNEQATTIDGYLDSIYPLAIYHQFSMSSARIVICTRIIIWRSAFPLTTYRQRDNEQIKTVSTGKFK